jgi:protein SCO1/2
MTITELIREAVIENLYEEVPHSIVVTIDEMAKRYGVAFMREKPNAQGAYLVNHARMIVLYGPQGEPIAIMPQGDDPKAVVAELARWVR